MGLTMRSGSLSRACAVLIVLCCLLPLAVLGAILFFDAPVWSTSLAALFVEMLLAWRLLVLLSTPIGEARPPDKPSLPEGLPNHDHRQY